MTTWLYDFIFVNNQADVRIYAKGSINSSVSVIMVKKVNVCHTMWNPQAPCKPQWN